ncbi:hypothetical protein [Frankia sp. R82]|uniref:hypothetical protein n=1 Tax=Frankia sp. R82 TaxID=2950553 RepID=UPI0020437D99|nr:hypothetical protein [Frankia sp. R82]MCM3886430.1 hypothetical protein [Frankia sp. R82]
MVTPAALTARQDLAALREIAQVPAQRSGPAGERLVPVVPPLAALLPQEGLRRGSTVAVTGSASLVLTLLCGPAQAGGWCAVVGFAQLGLLAAAESGIALERLALVPVPGPRWPVVVATLLDAMDVVVVCPPASPGAAGRRLMARARERGAVLVAVGAWEGADLRLAALERRWEGVGAGHGHVRVGHLLVEVSGRGAARRPRRAWVAVTGSSDTRSSDTESASMESASMESASRESASARPVDRGPTVTVRLRSAGVA